MLKALVVDDEARARGILVELLKEFCPQFTTIEVAQDVPSAVKIIQKIQPNVVFLDIEMPQYNGFQLFDFLEEVTFVVIFTTAYSEYALRAFEVSAIDYLLKPLQIEKMLKAVEKAEKQLENNNFLKENLAVLTENLKENEMSRVALPIGNGFEFIEVISIVYLKAEGAYTEVMLVGGRKIFVSKNLKSFENILTHTFFFRPHRSYIINLNRVKQFLRRDGGYIVMDTGEEIGISKEKRELFLSVYQIPK